MQPRISHDGTRIVIATGRDPDNNIWVLDISRGALTRLRSEAARDQEPSWSPDDRWILFASDRTSGDRLQIWRQAVDGTGEPELVVDSGVESDRHAGRDATHLHRAVISRDQRHHADGARWVETRVSAGVHALHRGWRGDLTRRTLARVSVERLRTAGGLGSPVPRHRIRSVASIERTEADRRYGAAMVESSSTWPRTAR